MVYSKTFCLFVTKHVVSNLVHVVGANAYTAASEKGGGRDTVNSYSLVVRMNA